MSESQGNWDDLLARMGTGAVLAVVGLIAMYLGGLWFHLLVAISAGIMIWELGRMLGAEERASYMGISAGLISMVAGEMAPALALPLLMAPGIVAFGQVKEFRVAFAVFTVAILVAGFGLTTLRDDSGFVWLCWLVLVVIATDVAGYFAGRIFGGPKFWPQVSPKKTWSGTVAGWVAAGIVGLIFVFITKIGPGLVGISLAMSMASQMGDIAESALKRQAGVKDSSSILPGHGGLFDRFDGLLGASIVLLLVKGMVTVPLTPQ